MLSEVVYRFFVVLERLSPIHVVVASSGEVHFNLRTYRNANEGNLKRSLSSSTQSNQIKPTSRMCTACSDVNVIIGSSRIRPITFHTSKVQPQHDKTKAMIQNHLKMTSTFVFFLTLPELCLLFHLVASLFHKVNHAMNAGLLTVILEKLLHFLCSE
jgi:hypothetical protein